MHRSQWKSAPWSVFIIADWYVHMELLKVLQEERRAFLRGDLETAFHQGYLRDRLMQSIASLEEAWITWLGLTFTSLHSPKAEEELSRAQGEPKTILALLWQGVRILKWSIQWLSAGNIALISHGQKGKKHDFGE